MRKLPTLSCTKRDFIASQRAASAKRETVFVTFVYRCYMAFRHGIKSGQLRFRKPYFAGSILTTGSSSIDKDLQQNEITNSACSNSYLQSWE